MMNIRLLLVFPLLALTSACATTPLPATDRAVAALTPADAIAPEHVGSTVRWGGLIMETRPGKGETCFEISSRPLDTGGEPLDSDRTDGRFIACAKGFHEPSVYAAMRKLTVVGTLGEPIKGNIGDHEIVFPRLKVETLHLWPVAVTPPYPWHNPFWNWPYRRRYWRP